MKSATLSIFASLVLVMAGCNTQNNHSSTVELKTQLDSVSYCLGQYIAKSEKTFRNISIIYTYMKMYRNRISMPANAIVIVE